MEDADEDQPAVSAPQTVSVLLEGDTSTTEHYPSVSIIDSMASNVTNMVTSDLSGQLLVEVPGMVHSGDLQSATADMLEHLPVIQIHEIQESTLAGLAPATQFVLHSGDKERNYPRLLAALASGGNIIHDAEGLQSVEVVESAVDAREEISFDENPDVLVSSPLTVPSSMLPINQTITVSCAVEESEQNLKSSLEENDMNSEVVLCMNPDSPIPEDHLMLVDTEQDCSQSQAEDMVLTNEELKDNKVEIWKPFREPKDEKPNKYTCKVFDSVIATVSEELLMSVKTQLYPNEQALNNSALLERLLVAKSHITDLMVREADTELQLAGDLIDIIEVHNVLMSHLASTTPCVHKPIQACSAVMRDKGIMCDGVPKPPTCRMGRRPKRSPMRDLSPESDPFEQEGSETSETHIPRISDPQETDPSLRRSNRRNRRPPVRMVDEDWSSKRSKRGRKLDNIIKLEPQDGPPQETSNSAVENSRLDVFVLNDEAVQGIGVQESFGSNVDGGCGLNLNSDLKPELPEPGGITLSVTQLTEDGVVDLLQSITQDVTITQDMTITEDVITTTVLEDSVMQEIENQALLEEEKQDVTDLPLPEKKKKAKGKDYESLMPFKHFCKECSFKTKRESHFLKHQQLHMNNLPVLKCSKCSYSTLHLARLRHHEVSHNPAALKCGVCKYRATTEYQMKKHIRMRHRDKKDELNALMNHKCPHCNYITDKLHLFQRHSLCHSHVLGNKSGLHGMLIHTYKCTHCPYTSNKKELFIRHMENVHSERRPYLCDLCGMGFKRKDTLKSHRLVHIEKSQRTYRFRCPHCNKGLRSKCHLDEHVSLHSNKREFLCEICGAAFKTRGIQRRHVFTIHKNPKAYPCATCNKSFNTKFALQRHLRIHEIAEHQLQQEIKLETMTFLCMTCKKTFNSKLSLQRHLRIHEYTDLQQEVHNQEQIAYEQEITNLTSFVEVVQGDAVNLPMDSQEHTEIIQVQPLSLQDQSLGGGQVITEFQVLPIQTALDQAVGDEDGSQQMAAHVMGEGLDGTQQNIEVQLQPTLVQTSTGTTTLLYLTTVPADVTQ